MHTAHQILKQYWGYSAFRPLQAQIIEAVLAHKDVLALLPTGGGKSLCFQVPALCQAGVCIVVTPLIALMKDQVAHLQKMGVAAKAIFSGMTLQEMDIALDSCIYGKVKFLYVSPERLHTELFQARVQKMNVCLLAVDEAHCISQWGYDFRPAYLKIQELRSLLPSLPTIALTATATKAVQVDIQEKLGFTNAIVFQQSFARKNLAYRASNIEDKAKSLLALCKQHPGTAIVYANTRKKTKIIAHMLKQQGLCADFYHAGLSTQERATKQDAWVHNKTNSIVATNAFGMGIHKPDVRLVVHYDLPASIEAYYQEVGRAGRDEKPATAIVLYDQHDIDLLRENIATQHPASHQLKKVYQHLANYYQVAIGSHQLATYDFDLEDFSNTYQLAPTDVYQALKKLEEQGLIQLSHSFFVPSQVCMAMPRQAVYRFQIMHAAYDALIKALLRIYGGALWTDFCKISEQTLATFLCCTHQEVAAQLQALHRQSVIRYIAQKEKPQLTFITARYPVEKLPLNVKKLQQSKAMAISKAEAMIHYVTHAHRCRAQLLLEYFSEISYQACGRCDVCLVKQKGSEDQAKIYARYRTLILQNLAQGTATIDSMLKNRDTASEKNLLTTIRQMLAYEEIVAEGPVIHRHCALKIK